MSKFEKIKVIKLKGWKQKGGLDQAVIPGYMKADKSKGKGGNTWHQAVIPGCCLNLPVALHRPGKEFCCQLIFSNNCWIVTMPVPALCRLGRLVLRPLLVVLLLTLLVVVVVLLSPLMEWIIKTMLMVMVMIWRIFLYPDSSRSATRETMPAKWQPSTKHSTAASSFDTFHHVVLYGVVKNIIRILLRPVVMRMTNSKCNG